MPYFYLYIRRFLVFHQISLQRYLNPSTDMYSKKIYTMLPRTTILKKKRCHKKLNEEEQLQQHSASVELVNR